MALKFVGERQYTCYALITAYASTSHFKITCWAPFMKEILGPHVGEVLENYGKWLNSPFANCLNFWDKW